MKTYIVSWADGNGVLGEYQAESEEGAVEAMARDAGYPDAISAALALGFRTTEIWEVEEK